ncbi:DUF6095 family protein [Polaribacter glomeratus]|uniref:Uncharacterized protein n=1 Tax=Polaribacter glomeratus TaxID=102 RepID=A0A2S7WY05_9FLAO|nr:DUF6095 family protein [Polaribacter glomeratus]PQJ82301.1 hypothetical protein BTO16_06795 [Polaribacter glomeratus]TXD66894.1 hypothetical protein ESX12_05100 [Polaribacter glomeratus]
MSTDVNLLSKGLIRLGVLVLFFIASPVIITMGFKALNKFTEAPKIYLAYALILVGLGCLIFTMIFAFKTFGILRNAIFTSK